jgi:hypothetical protein
MKNKIPYIIPFFFLNSFSRAEILTVGMDSGFDSNPFHFSELHPIESDSYIETRIKYRQIFEPGFYFTGNLKSSIYLGDLDDANQTRFNFGGGFRGKFKIASVKSRFKLEARHYQLDKTYVSRATGQIATFAGVEISDRYDSNWMNFLASMDFEFNKSFEIDVAVKLRNKSYENLTALGLSNLDYSQEFIETRLIYNQDKENRFRFGAESGVREYDNRLAKLVNGDTIPASNLEYEYTKYSFEFRSKKGKATGTFGFDAELREDNGGGFYDTVTSSAFGKLKYKKKSGSFVSLKLAYNSSKFDNSIPLGLVQNEEEIRSREGFTFDLEYNRNLVDFGYKDLFFHLKYSYEDYDNADPFYVYDQSKFQAGLNWIAY